MYREIGVALAVAHLGVLQSTVGDGTLVGLLHLAAGQRAEGLGQDGHRHRPDGHLTGARPEERAGHPDVIVQVEEHDQVILARQELLFQVELDAAARVFEMGEGGLALRTQGHQPPGERDHRSVVTHLVVVGVHRLAGSVGAVEPVGKGIDAHRLEAGPVVTTGLFDIVPFGRVGHAAWPPKRLR